MAQHRKIKLHHARTGQVKTMDQLCRALAHRKKEAPRKHPVHYHIYLINIYLQLTGQRQHIVSQGHDENSPRLRSVTQQLQNLEQQLATMQQQMHTQEGKHGLQLAALQASASSQEAALKAAQSNLANRNALIAQLRSNGKTQSNAAAQVAILQEQLAAIQASISTKNAQIASFGSLAADRNRHVANLVDAAHQKNAQTKNLQERFNVLLKTRNNIRTKLNGTEELRRQTEMQQSAQQSALQAEVARLQATLDTTDKRARDSSDRLADITLALQKKALAADEAARQVAGRDAMIVDLQAQLQAEKAKYLTLQQQHGGLTEQLLQKGGELQAQQVASVQVEQRLNVQIEQLTQNLTIATAQLASYKETVQHQDSDMKTLLAEKADLTQKLQAASVALQQSQTAGDASTEKLKNQIADLTSQARLCTDNSVSTQTLVTQLRAEVQSLTAELKASDLKKAQGDDTLAKAHATLQQVTDNRDRHVAQLSSLRLDHNRLQRQMGDRNGALSDLQQKISSAAGNRNGLKGQLEDLQSDHKGLAVNRNSLQAQLAALQGQYANVAGNRNALRQQIEELREQVTRNSGVKFDLNAVTANRNKIRNQFSDVSAQLSGVQSELYGVKTNRDRSVAELQALQNKSDTRGRELQTALERYEELQKTAAAQNFSSKQMQGQLDRALRKVQACNDQLQVATQKLNAAKLKIPKSKQPWNSDVVRETNDDLIRAHRPYSAAEDRSGKVSKRVKKTSR